MLTLPKKLCDAGRLIFSKRLTDMAGGNLSTRDEICMYITPRYAGQRYHWDLTEENLVAGDWLTDEITQNPNFSREGWSHLYIYREFPNVKAVVHAHAFHVMPFAAACREMEPMLEATRKFGKIPLCASAPAHTRELAENVLAAMRGQENRMQAQAAAVLIPYHGIILAGEDFDKTLDALERIDENAYCLTVRKLLE
ncbi:MAG: class II aldolase/adducin family protein [Chloroflexota bacterium]